VSDARENLERLDPALRWRAAIAFGRDHAHLLIGDEDVACCAELVAACGRLIPSLEGLALRAEEGWADDAGRQLRDTAGAIVRLADGALDAHARELGYDPTVLRQKAWARAAGFAAEHAGEWPGMAAVCGLEAQRVADQLAVVQLGLRNDRMAVPEALVATIASALVIYLMVDDA
jgi:hypothetical protein